MTENMQHYTENGKKYVQIEEVVLKDLVKTNYYHEMKAMENILEGEKVVQMQKDLEYTSPFIKLVENNGKTKIEYDHVGQAIEIIQELKIMYNKFGMFYYNENTGLWYEDTLPMLKKTIQFKLGKYSTKARMAETLLAIERCYDQNVHSIPFDSDPYLVPFKNGILDIKKNDFRDYRPTDYITKQLPHKYNKNTDNPETEKYLTTLFGERKQFVYEWLGYTLFSSYSFQYFLILLGNGRNGKSVFLDYYKMLIGKNNVSNLSLKSLQENNFAQACLYGKMANIFADIGDDYFRYTEIIKTLTGNDSINVDRKNQGRLQFTNHAKLTFSCNTMPTFKDRTEGLARRIIILPMTKTFEKTNNNTDIVKILSKQDEVEATLVKAIEAFQKVLKQGDFSFTEDMNQAKHTYLENMDLVKQFVSQECSTELTDKIEKTRLFEAFMKFLADGNYNAKIGKHKFYEQLTQTYPHIVEFQFNNSQNKRERAFKGINLI